MGPPSITRCKGKIFVPKNGSFLEKEFLSKEVSGRKVELDECRGFVTADVLVKGLSRGAIATG